MGNPVTILTASNCNFSNLFEWHVPQLARQIKSLFRQNRSLCGTSIKVGMGTPLRVFV
jgi:hypothetical protein